MQRRLAVISDLHISNGELDDFDDELEGHLVTFLAKLKKHAEPVELVINGDFLDFVQASPWSGSALESVTADGIPLCFTEAQSLEKLASIEAQHWRTFDAIEDFLSDKKNRLVIMPGNHDPDFFWKGVQERFAQRIGVDPASDRLKFHLELQYRPHGMEWLLIEHGHQYDQVNAFYINGHQHWSAKEPPILKGEDGVDRLYECIGTRFLIRYINGLDRSYPYVDNVKPFGRFLRIFGASALTPGWGPVAATIAVGKMFAYLAKTVVTRRGGDLLSSDPDVSEKNNEAVVHWLNHATESELNDLADNLSKRGYDPGMPLDVLAGRPDDVADLANVLVLHPDLGTDIGEKDPSTLGAADGTLGLWDAYDVNESLDLYEGAKNAALDGVNTVIMGHTHEPFDRDEFGLTYFNIGSWTRYRHFGEDEAVRPWTILKEEAYAKFPYRLRYAQVEPGAKRATIETHCEGPTP